MTTHSDERGVPRQNHYGAGRQPWDEIVSQGWGPEFAAGNVLKYLRRDKAHEHSLESARWYHARLAELMRGKLLPASANGSKKGRSIAVARAAAVAVALDLALTADERKLLREDPR